MPFNLYCYLSFVQRKQSYNFNSSCIWYNAYIYTINFSNMISSHHFVRQTQFYSEQEINEFLQLEGECKIISIKYVKFSNLKTCLLIIPVILSIIGLFMLKYYKWFRIKVFYVQADFQTASHVYIYATNKSEDIQKLCIWEKTKKFTYQELKYQIVDSKPIPIGLNLKRFYSDHVDNNFCSKGLSYEQYQMNLQRYGRNQHLAHAPNYFQYMFENMTQPFFLLQYLAAGIYLAQRATILAIILLSASVITVTINYILLYYSYKKIKEMAEKQIRITVIRNGEKIQILQPQIVPGDIYEATQEVPCDSLLLQGEVYANQASLTGQSIPIGKFAIKNIDQLKQSKVWLYEGSNIISSRLNPLALAVYTGYTSKRGRIIRKILHRNPKQPQFYKTFIYFLTQAYIVGGIAIFFSTLKFFIDAEIETSMIVLVFFLYVTFCYPPAFPIYFNLAYSYSLARLKFKNIHGTQPQKTIQSTNLQIVCFDKTGTLTQQKLLLHKVYKYFDKYMHKDITDQLDDKQNRIQKMIFACCHTVKEVDSQFQGDEVDLKMFSHTKCKITVGSTQLVLQDIACLIKNDQFQVLRINQYESRFQSMTVMVRDKQTKKYYILAKGAPQKIHKSSSVQIQGFSQLVKTLSYGGFRTIGFGYKQIKENQYSHYMKATRQEFLQAIKLTGVVAFENKLKDDAVQTIKSLNKAQIQPKMITGDNIFIAIQTAARAQIVDKNEQIGVIQGALQKRYKSQKIYNVKIVSHINNQLHIRQVQMDHKSFMTTKLSLAVDNDFLQLKPTPFLIHQIKIYSRISPQNKARIVRTLKQQIKLKHKSQSFFKRVFGKGVQTIGMVGDGANDLIAIKEADIGLGISNSDASFAASFSISKLMDVDQIIRQSKSTERSIMQICRFFSISGLLNIIQVSLLFPQGSFFSQAQLGYTSFTRLIVVSIVISLSKPSKKTTKYRPCSNFMGLENHLVYWGNIIIYSLGFIFVYFYGRDYSGQFEPNPKPVITFSDPYYSKTFSVTLQFLIYCMSPQTLVFYIYKSKPWKERIWNNYLLLLSIIINMGLGIAGFFLTNQLASILDLVPLPRKLQVTVFIISLVTVIVAFFYNLLIDCLKFHEREYLQLSIYNQNNEHLYVNRISILQLAVQQEV